MNPRHTIRSRLIGVNVPPLERLATGLVGGAAAVLGLRARSFAGVLAAGVGAGLVARAMSGRCPAYRARAVRKGIQVRRAITIQCSPREVYDLWRDLPNLPRFMHHLESVTMKEGGISHWVAIEGGKRLEWDARVVVDTPGRRIAWQALPGGDIDTTGSVEMIEAPGDRGTEVEVKIHYMPPGGLLVASVLHAFLRKLVSVQLGTELVRLRQLLETGEIATGARRIGDVDEEDKGAVLGSSLQPESLPPVTTADSSSWETPSGGTR